MIAFSTWSLPAIDAKRAVLLHVFLPFVVGFVASRLFYGWVNKAGLQSAGFSPTVALILTTPLLAVAYYMLAATDFVHDSIRGDLHRTLALLVLFAPMIFVLSPVLAIYLRGGLRRKKILGIILCGAAIASVILEFLGIHLLFHGAE
jgi:hypothetical protein